MSLFLMGGLTYVIECLAYVTTYLNSQSTLDFLLTCLILRYLWKYHGVGSSPSTKTYPLRYFSNITIISFLIWYELPIVTSLDPRQPLNMWSVAGTSTLVAILLKLSNPNDEISPSYILQQTFYHDKY
ncbi:hypothetical protein Ancab_019209 [Ancistrocladus abbreviatus]